MTSKTQEFQDVLATVDELVRERFRTMGYAETPFLLLAISPDDVLVMQGNFNKAGLKMLAADLAEAAEEADDDPVH